MATTWTGYSIRIQGTKLPGVYLNLPDDFPYSPEQLATALENTGSVTLAEVEPKSGAFNALDSLLD